MDLPKPTDFEKVSQNSISQSLFNKNQEYISGHYDYDSSSFLIAVKPKPWYFTNGTRYPKPASISNETGIRDAKLLPHEDPGSDRIVNQMMFIPPNYDPSRRKEIMKTIYVPLGLPSWWRRKSGESAFVDLKCPVDACRITDDAKERKNADLVMFNNDYIPSNETRPPKQLYAMYYTEPPVFTNNLDRPDVINWTISYRYDSTIAVPYNKWLYYDPRIKQKEQDRNYAANKTKKVAWFVSNCVSAINGRLEYAKELQKHIQVDIYGKCGNLTCTCKDKDKCFDMLDEDYKFYLSFENSNCKDYITEKFFDTGLQHNILPIVMGAPCSTYEKYAPHRSYIHVEDFESPKQLAEYLHILDRNDNLYNSYFKWKGTGEFVGKGPAWRATSGPYFFCRLCAMLHDEYSTTTLRWYSNMNEWQHGKDVCIKGFWRDVKTENS
ncbi:glycoprotein 3-alpha-L-fucosyltransferase A-like [Sitodiplosis mosellana]|uniref:glycoprotein 3-alpha-L-fucosyltransferase A-like n=1 Tax=Sitodiplosis mosellana TaxID=263140 RepID=UPI002443C954|nr:glycoprotein 3-alpha-L-fucosyltransferase A-like [Sitodiplosis mosellana]